MNNLYTYLVKLEFEVYHLKSDVCFCKLRCQNKPKTPCWIRPFQLDYLATIDVNRSKGEKVKVFISNINFPYLAT